MSHLRELADLFDKLADEYEREPEAPPAVKTAAAEPQAPTVRPASEASKLADLVRSATGESLPSDVAERIASDRALLEEVTKLAEHGARPTPLGDAVTKTGSTQPTTKREKTAAMWERWNESVRNW